MKRARNLKPVMVLGKLAANALDRQYKIKQRQRLLKKRGMKFEKISPLEAIMRGTKKRKKVKK